MATRDDVVTEALTWEGTPFHHHARLKGVGVDCAMFLAEVYHAVAPSLVPRIAPAHYPVSWHLHHDEELFVGWVRRYTDEFDGPPLAGDIVLFKTGRAYGHGAISIDWPDGVHAASADGAVVTRADLTQGWLAGLSRRYFSIGRLLGEV